MRCTMNEIETDIDFSISSNMWLEIKEMRGTYTTYHSKNDNNKVTKETKDSWHWKLHGLSAKLDHTAPDCDFKNQEVYNISISCSGFDFGFAGFKSKEEAVTNALEFAKRNNIKIDGYANEQNNL